MDLLLTRDGMKSLLEAVEDERLAKVAEESVLHSRSGPRTMFSSRHPDFETFLEWISRVSKYGRTFEYSYESEGRTFTLSFQHNLGEKWTYLRYNIAGQLKNLFGVVPQVEITRNSIIMRANIP